MMVMYSMVNSKISSLTMGSLMMGAVVNFFETTFHRDIAKHTLALLDPCVILYEEKYKTTLMDLIKNIKVPNLKFLLSIDGKSRNNVDHILLKPITSFLLPNLGDPRKETAILLFTSGSTGMPKAVALSHSQMLLGANSFFVKPNGISTLTAESVIFCLSPIRWISQVDLMLQSLLTGVKRIYATGLATGHYATNILSQNKVTHFFSPPSVFNEIIHSIKPQDPEVLSSLKAIYIGGEDPGQSIIDMAHKLIPQVFIMRCYGMTELAGVVSCDYHINGGYILPGVELRILDDNLKPVEPNQKGQLCFRFPMPFLGYYKVDGNKNYYEDGFLNSGDYGYVDDNKTLHVKARYNDLIRTKEVILIPSEVEKLICSLPNIMSATLVGYRPTSEDEEDKGALYIIKKLRITNSDENGKLMELENALLKDEVKNLIENHLDKKEFNVIRLIHVIEKLPLTSCGKVDKPSLIKLAKSLDLE